MNRKQRRAARAEEPLNIGPPINGDQGQALTDLVIDFLKANLGFEQPFAILVSNGEQINVLGNAGPEVLASMIEIISLAQPHEVKTGALSGQAAGRA